MNDESGHDAGQGKSCIQGGSATGAEKLADQKRSKRQIVLDPLIVTPDPLPTGKPSIGNGNDWGGSNIDLGNAISGYDSWAALDILAQEWNKQQEKLQREREAAEAKQKAEEKARKDAEEKARAQAEAEFKAKAEAEARAKAIAEGSKIGVTAAEAKVREAQERINQAAEQINQKNAQLASAIPPRDEKQKLVSMLTEMYQLDPSYLGQLEEEEGHLNNLQQQVDTTNAELNAAQQALNQANVDKGLADITLEEARKTEADARAQAEAEARAKAEAEARVKAAAEAAARAEAEAKARAEAEAKARAEAEAKAKAEADAKIAAELAKMGAKPAPTYSAEMIKAANAALGRNDALVLKRQPGLAQLAVAGSGAIPISGDVLGPTIRSGISALTTGAGVAGPLAGGSVVAAIFYSADVGVGSDKVPGRDVPALFSYPASVMLPKDHGLKPGVTQVDLPVRSALVMSNGELALKLLRTGDGLPKAVQVLTAVRDEKTGLDRITVPAVAGIPERTILINPAATPTAPSNTGNPAPPVPVTPVHTGTEVKPVDTITVTTTPVADHNGVQDFIYWQPNAKGTGVEPVYVVLSDSRGGTPELKIDGKIKAQMGERDWTEQDIKDTVAKGATGKSFDKRSPKKTPPDYLGRNDTATVYGESGKYVVVNDRTGEVTQISDKTDPKWVDDSRIQWGENNGK